MVSMNHKTPMLGLLLSIVMSLAQDLAAQEIVAQDTSARAIPTPASSTQDADEKAQDYDSLLAMWMSSDTDLAIAALNLQSQEIQFSSDHTGLDNSWSFGLGGPQSAGVEIRESPSGEGLYAGISPRASLFIGDEHQSSASISARVSGHGTDPLTVQPAVSLEHRLDDIFQADTADPDELGSLISLYQARIHYRQAQADSEGALLARLEDLWSQVLQIEAQEFSLGLLQEQRAEAVDVLLYSPDSSFVSNIDAQVSSATRRLERSRDRLNQDFAHFTALSSVPVNAAVLEDLLNEAVEPYIGEGSDWLAKPDYQVPETRAFSAYQLEALNLDLARLRLENSMEKEKADINLGLSADAAITERSFESGNVSGGISLNLGPRISGNLSLGYQYGNQAQGVDGPYLSAGLSWSSNQFRSAEDLTLKQLETQLQRSILMLENTEDSIAQLRVSYQNQLESATDAIQDRIDELQTLNQEAAELLESQGLGVASQDDIDQIEHEIRQTAGALISGVIEVKKLLNAIARDSLPVGTGGDQ